MKQFLEKIAAQPLDARKQALGARMRKFIGMPPAERQQAIAGLLNALGDVSESTRVACVKARTDLMTEIPKEHAEVLMGAIANVARSWSPERKAMEQRAVMQATEDYFFLKRRMVRKKFGALLA